MVLPNSLPFQTVQRYGWNGVTYFRDIRDRPSFTSASLPVFVEIIIGGCVEGHSAGAYTTEHGQS